MGGGSNGDGIPPASKKIVLDLKEIVNGSTEAEIYAALKDCNMDPNEAVNRLLSQDHFHEVKSKREKKKVKNTTESRPRGGSGSSTSNRGTKSGHSGPINFNSSESSGFQGKPTYKRENGTNSLAFSATPADGTSVSQPTSGYEPAWSGGPGQKSMADIVKMGRPQNSNCYTTSNASQQSINHNIVPENYPEYDHVSPDNDWPSSDQPQETNEYTGHETNEVAAQDESSSEDEIENYAGPASMTEPFYDNNQHNDVEEVNASLSSVSASIQNIQKLSVQEERDLVQPEEDVPSLVIPSHLQVNSADFSHLCFGSFDANINIIINTRFSRPSSVEHSETTNLEYYDDGLTRNITGGENYELSLRSQTSVLKQEGPELTHGNQSQFGFPPSDHSHTCEVTRGSQISTPFLNEMQAAANGNPVRESALSYSQFSVSQSMPDRFANSASSISDPTISIAEALKNVGLSLSQPLQQTPGGPQHLNMHPYSQPTLPLGLVGNMMGYPFLPQNYAYMPSGFQPTLAGNNTYHQQLAAMLPQYKNSVSVSSLPQSATVASGYGSFSNSTASPGNYQPAGPTGSTISYDDLLNAHYKDNSHLPSPQQNENSPMWAQGAGSRTMPAVPSNNAYYSLLQGHNQQQQPSGFRQGQQPSQSYGGAALNYPDFLQSQAGLRDAGSQGQPKLQSQQLWQNGY